MSITNKSEFIEQTATQILFWEELNQFRSIYQLSYREWRQIGDSQKSLYLDLLSQYSQPKWDVAITQELRKNTFLLEAIVEYYLESGSTEAKNIAKPVVNFLNPYGDRVRIQNTTIYLDGDFDLERVRPGLDTISLFDISRQTYSLYRIYSIDAQINAVIIEADVLPSYFTGPWRINLRAVLVIIDSFGNRIKGKGAKIVEQSTLDFGLPVNTLKINPLFDTVFLEQDTARASKTYRIVSIDNQKNTVSLDAVPLLQNNITNWGIPAGIGGELPSLDYDLGPNKADRPGWDHYDGVLFIVNQDAVQAIFRWTSYTSHNFPNNSHLLSSIRGNRGYRYVSQTAKTVRNINYAFSVFNLEPPDEPLEAYYYFDQTVLEDQGLRGANDTPGKTEVMIHIGWTQKGQAASGDGTGSAGCLASPYFYDLRDKLIQNYQYEQKLLVGDYDQELQKLSGATHQESVELWLRTSNGEGEESQRLSSKYWNNKIIGTLWLIRPDERSLG